MLFGGGETYRAAASRRHRRASCAAHMLRIYPQLADARIDYAWGGTLAVTHEPPALSAPPAAGRLHRLPAIPDRAWALAPFAGKILAEAIRGDDGALRRFRRAARPRFPGGVWLRHPTLVLAMTWYALRDRL